MSFATPPMVSNSKYTEMVSNSLLKLLENRGSLRESLRLAHRRDLKGFETVISAIAEDLRIKDDMAKLSLCLIMILGDKEKYHLIHRYMFQSNTVPKR